jgi:dienelactone hydrolase
MDNRLRGLLAIVAGVIAILVAWPGSGLCDRSVEVVQFPTAAPWPHPVQLRGFLRRPSGGGPSGDGPSGGGPSGGGRFAAVVLLHGCGGDAAGLDRNWGARLQAWGYVSLTVDSFTPRGITNSCRTGTPAGRSFDAGGAVQFLSQQPFIDATRVALMGFSAGGIMTLLDVEPRQLGGRDIKGFRAAVAVYPICSESGVATVPTLILNGQLDDWSPAEACRKMVQQQSDIGVTRQQAPTAPMKLVVLAGAYHKFDDPKFRPGRRYMGHWLAYDAAATATAAEAIQEFLSAQLGR